MNRPIWVDDEATWPVSVLDVLKNGLSRMLAYETDREAIDRRCREDVLFQVRPPTPVNAPARRALLSSLNSNLAPHAIVGYHCTRLHRAEIASITRHGLRPLSEKLARARIERCIQLGELSRPVASRLLSKNAVNDEAGSRLSMIWFCFTRNPLQDDDAVGRFFRSWGGEALYCHYGEDVTIGPALSNIGVPAIVEAAVPVRLIQTFMSVGERFLNVFLSQRGISTGHDSNMEGYIREPLNGHDILRIVTSDDQEFRELTNCEGWSTPLS